jgi:hypothetical protein
MTGRDHELGSMERRMLRRQLDERRELILWLVRKRAARRRRAK